MRNQRMEHHDEDDEEEIEEEEHDAEIEYEEEVKNDDDEEEVEEEEENAVDGMKGMLRKRRIKGPGRKKTAQGQLWSAIPSALLYTFWECEMYTAGQRVLLTIAGPAPSFFLTKN